MLFLLIATVLAYLSYRNIWSGVKNQAAPAPAE
jgi:cytochrome c1